MRIRVQQLNVIVGDIRGNTKAILDALREAEKDGIGLLVLPELVICGYPPMDLLERKSFIRAVYSHTEQIVKASGKTAILFGTVRPNNEKTGRPIFNAAVLAQHREIVDEIYKTLLPTYDVFDEFRYFESNRNIHVTKWEGITWGITLCEDIWNHENEYNYHTYEIEPAPVLKEQGAQILINISASPFTKNKPELRQNMLQRLSRRLDIPLIYCNQTGANTELIFDGASTVTTAGGSIALKLATLEEDKGDVIWTDPASDPRPVSPNAVSEIPGREDRLFKALVLGLRDYVYKSGMPGKVVLGLSGGIDSALVAAVAAEAMGPENVTGITMPSQFSSEESVSDSVKLADNLGINIHKIAIGEIYDIFLQALDPLFRETAFDVAEENIQSRIRGAILMAVSNKFGHMLLNTGNKSELAVGYCTLYGDMAGGLSVLSDVYKTEVYAISRRLNEHWYEKEVIPEAIIEKPPSAELRPGQKDTDSLPDYEVLDGILKAYIEEQHSAAQIVESGYPVETVHKVINMVDGNEYKRRQAAPGLRVSSKAFGQGRRFPIVQRWKEL